VLPTSGTSNSVLPVIRRGCLGSSRAVGGPAKGLRDQSLVQSLGGRRRASSV